MIILLIGARFETSTKRDKVIQQSELLVLMVRYVCAIYLVNLLEVMGVRVICFGGFARFKLIDYIVVYMCSTIIYYI